jgi:hypothetical protein
VEKVGGRLETGSNADDNAGIMGAEWGGVTGRVLLGGSSNGKSGTGWE